MPSLPRRLRIHFVLPSLSFTGGVRVVFEHTRGLVARGHEVGIIVPRLSPGIPWSAAGRERLRRWLVARFVEQNDAIVRHYRLTSRILTVPSLDPRYFPDGDVLIATAWRTAHPVADAPTRCGRGAYLIQHYEAFEPGIEEDVDATWRLPLERLVVSSWLAELAEHRFGVAARGPLGNGVDLTTFHPRGRSDNDPMVVGMLYELQPWKGLEDGFDAIRRARREVPALRLLCFGRYRLRHPLRKGDRFVRNPSQGRIGSLYRSCDLFLSTSWSEGWGLPAMEAMACGCAVVSTESGGIRDFAVPGVTVLTAPPRDPERIADALVRLATDRELRLRIAPAGRAHVTKFTWETATARLERHLLEIASGGGSTSPGADTAGDQPAAG